MLQRKKLGFHRRGESEFVERFPSIKLKNMLDGATNDSSRNLASEKSDSDMQLFIKGSKLHRRQMSLLFSDIKNKNMHSRNFNQKSYKIASMYDSQFDNKR